MRDCVFPKVNVPLASKPCSFETVKFIYLSDLIFTVKYSFDIDRLFIDLIRFENYAFELIAPKPKICFE